MVDIRWVWLHLHHEDGAAADRGWDFWRELTGGTLSPRRGAKGELATLLPETGDAWVTLQRTGSGRGVHVDLDVPDVAAAAREAQDLGAVVQRVEDDVTVLRSPGGLDFCLTQASPEPRRWVRRRAVLVDQACLDAPAELFDAELAFWSSLTGWPLAATGLDELRALRRPDEIPVRLLLQRLGEEDGRVVVTAHPDLSCADRRETVTRMVALGAEVLAEGAEWTVLRDPGGLTCCATDRDPLTSG